MELTSEEKKLIVSMLQRHLSEVKAAESLPKDYVAELGIEINYDVFVTNIIKKLSQ
jgi:hypothetical protein